MTIFALRNDTKTDAADSANSKNQRDGNSEIHHKAH